MTGSAVEMAKYLRLALNVKQMGTYRVPVGQSYKSILQGMVTSPVLGSREI